MEAVFQRVLEMSASACWLILALLLLRAVFRRLPRRIFCALWCLVALRLAVPISMTSELSLQPRAEHISGWTAQIASGLDREAAVKLPAEASAEASVDAPADATDDEGIEIPDEARTDASGNDNAYTDSALGEAEESRSISFYLSVAWLFGIAIMLLYALLGYIRLKRRVAAAVKLYDNIFCCDEIAAPFILGVLIPRIYVPSSLSENELRYVVAHERAHLLRYDHWRKAAGFLLLAMHWFNPLVWIAYLAFSNDIELACDEAVTRDYDASDRRSYAKALLECGRQRQLVYVYPLGFGEIGVKSRVKAVLLSGRKPSFWATVAGAVLCAAIALGFLASPQRRVILPDEPIVFETEGSDSGYITLKWNEEGLSYVPFSPAEVSLVGDCIGYWGEEDDKVYVCTVNGYSEREWLIDMLGDTVSGHSEPTLWREVHTTDIPDGWSSEYEWNDLSELSAGSEPSADSDPSEENVVEPPQDYDSANEVTVYSLVGESGEQTLQTMPYDTERSIPLKQLDESQLHWTINGNLLYVETAEGAETVYYVERSAGDENVALVPFPAEQMEEKARQAIKLEYDESTNSYMMIDRATDTPVAAISLIDDVYIPLPEEISFENVHFIQSGDRLLAIFKGIPLEKESDPYFGYLTLEVGVNVGGADGDDIDFTLKNPGTYSVGGVEDLKLEQVGRAIEE